MCVCVGGSKAKVLQACLIYYCCARARSKRSKEDSLPQETGRATCKSSRYIILLKVKRVCRLDQNTVTMALRRVFYSLSLSTTTLTHAGFYTRILINSILNTLSKYAYFHAK